MKWCPFGGMISLSVLALLSFMPRAAGSQEGETRVLKTKVLDLTFTVQDMGGKVRDVQLKETESEIRIELAADVLFDYDKIDILPKAREAMKQTAEVIERKQKGMCGSKGTRTRRVLMPTTRSSRNGGQML